VISNKKAIDMNQTSLLLKTISKFVSFFRTPSILKFNLESTADP